MLTTNRVVVQENIESKVGDPRKIFAATISSPSFIDGLNELPRNRFRNFRIRLAHSGRSKYRNFTIQFI